MITNSHAILPPQSSGNGGLPTRRGYYIYITEACNLRCSYCFVKNKQNNRHLTMPTATKLIDFIAEDAASLSSVYVHFFGGEPLLRPAMVDYLAGRLHSWSAERTIELRLGITTNGTLLTTANCEMLRKHAIGVQLSLDGSKEGNDIHRQLMGGTQCGLRAAGSFDRVNIANYISYFGKGSPNCRMTLTVHNLPYLHQSIRELHKLGFKSFSIIPDCDSATWTPARFAEYEDVMEKAFEYWLRHPDIWVNAIDKTIKALLTKKRRRCLCQVGKSIVGITVDGELYPCHDFSGQFASDPAQRQALMIGDVNTGYNANVQQFADMSIGPDLKSGCGYDCTTCWAKWACARGCPYMNYVRSGDIRVVNSAYCATQRVDALLALKWMGSADQVRFSYSDNGRGGRLDDRTRRVTDTGKEAAAVTSAQTATKSLAEAEISAN